MGEASAPRIAFAIPYYKGGDYLAETLTSVLAQDIDDWEAVVVDDAGPEPVEDLIRHLDDPRITYRRNAVNLGLAGNWTAAIEATRAPFVTVLHADDLLLPNYARTMIELMDRHPCALAGHCRVELIDSAGEPTRTLSDSIKSVIRPKVRGDVVTVGDRGLRSLLRGFWIFCPTLCYRREVFRTVEPFDGRWRFALDFSFVGRAILAGHSFVGSQVIGYRYRRHPANQTAVLTSQLTRFDEEIRLYGELADLAAMDSWSKSMRTARFALIIRAHLVVTAIGSLAHRDVRRAKEALRMASRKVGSR